MPTHAQLWRLAVGYPWHLDWTPDAELHNRLERLADVAAHHIAADGSQLGESAAAAIHALTDALVAVLPQYLAEHAATVWLIERAPGGVRRPVVDCVRIAARPAEAIGLAPGERPDYFRRRRLSATAPAASGPAHGRGRGPAGRADRTGPTAAHGA